MQRCLCTDWNRSFQYKYLNNGNAPDLKTRPSASNLSSFRECLCGANLRDGRAVELRWKQKEPTLALVCLGTSFSAGLAHAFSRRNEAIEAIVDCAVTVQVSVLLHRQPQYLRQVFALNPPIATKEFTQVLNGKT